jgi:hypothetical protein
MYIAKIAYISYNDGEPDEKGIYYRFCSFIITTITHQGKLIWTKTSTDFIKHHDLRGYIRKNGIMFKSDYSWWHDENANGMIAYMTENQFSEFKQFFS